MAREALSVTTVGSSSITAVAQTLLHRRVQVVTLSVVRVRTDGADGYDMQLVVELPDGAAVELVVHQLDRLVDVVEVVRVAPGQVSERLRRTPDPAARA